MPGPTLASRGPSREVAIESLRTVRTACLTGSALLLSGALLVLPASPASAEVCGEDWHFTSTVLANSDVFQTRTSPAYDCYNVYAVYSADLQVNVRAQYKSGGTWHFSTLGWKLVTAFQATPDKLVGNVVNGVPIRGQTQGVNKVIRYSY